MFPNRIPTLVVTSSLFLWSLPALAAGGQASTLTLVTSPNPSQLSQDVALTATLVPAQGTGRVNFYDGGTWLGSAAIDNGNAVLHTRLLAPGPRLLRADYTGDTSFAPSSGRVNQVVNALPVLALSPETHYTAGLNGNLLATDLNADGIPDLAVANASSNKVSVLLGRGDGTFQAALDYSTAGPADAVAVGDFNGNGIPDLVVAGPGWVTVLLGNGDGTFQNADTLCASCTITVSSLAVADFDRDGFLDIAVTYVSNGEVRVMNGRGDGTFDAPVSWPIGQYANVGQLGVGDFNEDDLPDLVVGGQAILLSNGDGTFRNISLGVGGTIPAVGDLNGDGHPDLVVTDEYSDYYRVLLGNGDGTFGPASLDWIGSPGFGPNF
jgi:hypothetical protein